MIRKLIMFIIVIIMLSLMSCQNDNEKIDLTSDETIQYEKNEIVLDINLQNSTNMQLYRDKVYFVGNITDANSSPNTVIINIPINDNHPEYNYIQFENTPYLTAVTTNVVSLVAYTYDEIEHINLSIFYIIDYDGNIIVENKISDLIKSYDAYNDKIYLTSYNDMIYLASDTTCIVLNENGDIITEYKLPDAITYMQATLNGEVYILGTATNNNCVPLNVVNSTTNEIKSEDIYSNDICKAIKDMYYVSDNKEIFFCTETALIKIDIFNKKSVYLCELSNVGIQANMLSSMICLNDDNILLYGTNILTNDLILWNLNQVSNEVIDTRTIIRVSYMEDGTNTVPTAVIKFNDISTKYKVVCEEYRSTNEIVEYNELLSAYDMDLLTGNIGDVLILSSQTDYTKYATKGAFSNLYEIIENDSNFSLDELFNCVTEPYETDGELYVIIPEFTINSLVGKTKNIPNNTWNINTMLDLINSLSNNSILISGMTRDMMFNKIISAGADEFIDFEYAKCSFDNDGFMSLLEYIASFPEVLSNDINTIQNSDNISPYVHDEIILYETLSFSCLTDYLKLRARFGFDNEINMIGYPSKNGGASTVIPRMYCAISSKSENQNGAWEFIKYMISSDNIVDISQGMRYIPSLRESFKQWLKEGQNLYYYFIKDTIKLRINNEPYNDSSIKEPGYTVTINDELCKQFENFIDNIENTSKVNNIIMGILQEEVNMYFSGDKTAEETVKIIQNRVSLYLNEQN